MDRPQYQMDSPQYQMDRPQYQMDSPQYQMDRPQYQMDRPQYQMDRKGATASGEHVLCAAPVPALQHGGRQGKHLPPSVTAHQRCS
jgi:hypothetical protein